MTYKTLYTQTKNALQKAGVEDPAFDTLCLLEKIFGFTRSDLILYGEREPDSCKLEAFLTLAERRKQHEPLQYILGSWIFMDLPFCVGKGVLIPREDTEAVVSLCMDYLRALPSPASVLDLCAGSGAISVVLAKHFPACRVFALEKSKQAYAYLCKNIAQNRVSVKPVLDDLFSCKDLFDGHTFDLIVSNPPYIRRREIPALQSEVQHEPRMALDGGEDGYTFYRFIIAEWKKKLKAGGGLAFELGENQFDTVKNLMETAGFTKIQEKRDIGNTQRAIIGTLKQE